MHTSRRALLIAGTAALLSLGSIATAAAQASSQAVIDAAKKEGKLVVYTGLVPQTTRPVTEAFTAKYPGIEIEFVSLSNAPLQARLMTEQDAGQNIADMILGMDLPRVMEFQKKGYLASYVSPQATNYPAEAQSSPAGLWTRTHGSYTGWFFNRSMVPADKVPKTLDDLLKPEWAGKITLLTPSNNDLVIRYIDGLMKDYGEDKILDYLKKLNAQQKPVIFGPVGTRVVQAVATGEFPIGLGFISQTLTVGDGSKSVGVVPIEPVYPNSDNTNAVMAKAPHPNAARLFLDFFLSKEVQEGILLPQGNMSSYKGIAPPELYKGLKLASYPAPDPARLDALRKKMIEIFGN